MSRLILVAAIMVLLSGPNLVACEKCVPKGTRDPNGGGPYGSAICWTAASGLWSWCVGGNITCTGGNPENTCPESGSGQCATLPGGVKVCVEHPVPIKSEPLGRCSGADVQGRCVERQVRTALLN